LPWSGNHGNDYLNPGPDHDQVFGDAGNDQIASIDGIADSIDGGVGFDRIRSDILDTASGIEALLL
jgi:hypothetical protein